MLIHRVYLQNFGSYKELDFDFTNQGLTLISGPTGSGKSTLMDAIPWCLFGFTSKGGSVDEIRSWTGKGVTSGTVVLDNDIIVYRSRNPNDLRFEVSGRVIRGKDLKDTQKLLDEQLGVDYETFLSGSYFHEFSQTASFFTTAAKSRRQICEQLVDLSLPKTLQEKISVKNKDLRKSKEVNDRETYALSREIDQLKQIQGLENSKHADWERSHVLQIENARVQENLFEKTRKSTIHKECKTCGTVLESPREIYNDATNPYTARITELSAATNPHTAGIQDFSKEIHKKTEEWSQQNQHKKIIESDLYKLDILKSLVESLRSTMIGNTIGYIQDITNQLLEKHFDGEIKVEFTALEADKLEVMIQKDGNQCSFSQLSKGQRQILKLCFGVSVMKSVSNHKGVHFSQIFLDEFADGLDENMKIKSFGLLEELALEHESVFAIDHSEGLKSCFSNVYNVRLVNGESQIKYS